jgi:hypothetical protein
MSDITGRGYKEAYENAQSQFTKDREYGLGALKDLAGIGEDQRAIEAEGIAADIQQFEDERDDPYKKVQYMRSLLQGLPLETQSYNYSEPSGMQNLGRALGDASGIYTQLEDWWKSRSGGGGGGGGGTAFDWNAYDTYVQGNLLGGMTQAEAEAAARATMGITS